jgi:uncharacterized membrane protein
MIQPKRAWTNERIEQIVGTLLRSGVIIAASVVLVGGIPYLVRYGATLPDYRVFRGAPTDLRSLSGIVTDTLSFRFRGIIQLGLLLLIATPAARVAFSVVAFVLQKDRIYVIVTLIVFAVLMYSLIGGGL